MKLNHDCVRSILIELENHPDLIGNGEHNSLSLGDLLSKGSMAKFDRNVVLYAALMLEEAGLIKWTTDDADDELNDAYFDGLTYAGHEYLDAIRSDNVWKKVGQKLVENGGSLAFSVIQVLATRILLG